MKNGKSLDRGLEPDVEVVYTPNDYTNQRDTHLEAVKGLMKKDLAGAW